MKKIASIILLAFFFLPTGIGHSLDIDSPRKYQNISQEIVPSYTPNLFSNFKTTHMVPMRDGIKLATDVYRPVFPPASKTTLLLRTPYNKDDMSLVGILGIILGWPTVIQDMRGRFASEGNDTVFKNENTDGVDTLAWITNQSWSDGKIVTFGPSAMGIPQYCLAGENPENLTCQFVQIATPNLYHHATFQGGEFRKNLVEEWLGDQSSSYMLQEILNNENFTLGYWGNVTLDNNWEKVNIPAIHVGGWYDIFSQGTIDAYCGYQHLAGAGARGNSKLIMGPWTHTGFFQRTQGELIYPRNSLDRFSLRMFRDMVRSYALNDIDTYSCWPTVSYYVMGDVNDPRAPGNE
ncbi:hypothetical protein AYK25_04825 [Thermoplasmatales archaeon SM1-50]|nr:MAG: hypothetical protein AYK25_04825 [Thermoplasmatales archaeon SM1-50]